MWYEWADAILEYAEEKIIVTLDPSSFLVLDEWKPVRCITDKDLNINQRCIKPHPEFDLDNFPFLIVSGKNHMSLINLQEFTVEKFVNAGFKN